MTEFHIEAYGLKASDSRLEVLGLPGFLVTEQAALRVLGIHIPPVGQDEGQTVQASLQQTPQTLGHKLVPLFGKVQPVGQVHRVVLGSRRWKRGQNSWERVYEFKPDMHADMVFDIWRMWPNSFINNNYLN